MEMNQKWMRKKHYQRLYKFNTGIRLPNRGEPEKVYQGKFQKKLKEEVIKLFLENFLALALHPNHSRKTDIAEDRIRA